MVVLAVPMGIGCSDGESSEIPDVTTFEDPGQAGEVAYAEAYCECRWETDGFADELACAESNDGFETSECEAEVLFDDERTAERLQCLYEAALAEAQCIHAAGCNEDDDVLSGCAAEERELIDACPAYPDDIQEAVDACNEPEPYWAVGDGGMVFGVDVAGSGSAESPRTNGDLTGIACDGQLRAWVVGASGFTMHTEDAGEHWTVSPVSVSTTLRAVAHLHGDGVIAVGDDGVFVSSDDGGNTWSAHPTPRVDFTGVAATSDLAWVATTRTGSVLRRGASGEFEIVYEDPSIELTAVAADHHSTTVAAAGTDGVVLLSTDQGRSWSRQIVAQGRTLHAVNVLGPTTVLAVGDRGTIARLERGVLDLKAFGSANLYGLHIAADGAGAAVGESGRILETRDAGQTWRDASLPIAIDLRGLDQPLASH